MRINDVLARCYAWLPALPADKLLHFVAGAVITAVVALCRPVAVVACFAGVLAGIVKECYDWQGGGQFDVLDVVATASGAVAMQLFIAFCLLCWQLSLY